MPARASAAGLPDGEPLPAGIPVLHGNWGKLASFPAGMETPPFDTDDKGRRR